jgi:hypothetical protein
MGVITNNGYIRISVIGTQSYVDSININKVRDEIIEKYTPKKILLSNPTVTCSVPKLESMVVSRLMNDEELVDKIISTGNSLLPDKLLYDTGIKYLRRARE